MLYGGGAVAGREARGGGKWRMAGARGRICEFNKVSLSCLPREAAGLMPRR